MLRIESEFNEGMELGVGDKDVLELAGMVA